MRATVVFVYWSLYWNLVWPALSGTRWAVRLLFYVIRSLASVLPHLPPTTVLAASIQILCDNILALRNHHSHYQKTNKTKKNGIVYIYTSYLARTQKIEEIVTLNTLMKPIFNWGRLASWIVMAARGWSNRDLVTRGNHSPWPWVNPLRPSDAWRIYTSVN